MSLEYRIEKLTGMSIRIKREANFKLALHLHETEITYALRKFGGFSKSRPRSSTPLTLTLQEEQEGKKASPLALRVEKT